ncbi:MAG: molybdopterin oxidoreductase [Ignavibacteriae bacterium]|nr:MAG: molybdopterin oxidoreductase [Ignavibacteriota bacterium]
MSKNNGTKKFWKSIKEYQDDPKLLEEKLHEFKEGVTDDFSPDDLNKFSRRKFLAVLAASTAYAATACTSYRDKGEIVPYIDRPEEILPGKPTFYASTFAEGDETYGIVVKTREGRPIKIEGNPDDKISGGKIPSKVHASILNLYDPERLKEPKINGRNTTWDKITSEITSLLNNSASNGKEIAFITNPIPSSTTKKIIDEFLVKYKTAKVYSYKLSGNGNRKNAWLKGYNSKIIPSIKWDKAKVIISLEGDFLGREGNTVENGMLYSKGRDIANSEKMNKLYALEGNMSLTGMNADVRYRLSPKYYIDFLLALMKELNFPVNNEIKSYISQASIAELYKNSSLDKNRLKKIADDLLKNKGKSIIYAGDSLPEEIHLVVNLLNELLGNKELYDFQNGYVNLNEFETENSIADLIKNKGTDVIIHFDSNPVYEIPGYSEFLENIQNTITISEAPNETVFKSKYVLPINNILESWGEYQTRNGQVTMQQPVIVPLFNTKQKEEIILSWLNGGFKKDAYLDYLKNNLKESVYSKGNFATSFNNFWNNALYDGVIPIKAIKSNLGNFDDSTIKIKNRTKNGFAILIQKNYYFDTGKYANNGWLQELPHPVSKVTWDNYAAISPGSGEKLGVSNNDLIKITISGKTLELPVLLQPGMADETVALELGYGRKDSGEVANDVGFNVNVFLNGNDINKKVFYGAEVVKTNGTYKLASTQEHHSLNDDSIKNFHLLRNIIQEGTLEEYKKNPHFLHEHKHEIFSITDNHLYPDEKWAMSIDLNKCLGCSECITSCNVENNIPVVGKDQVAIGREMHWLRVDRYYSGTPEEPIVSTQPMLCQHCDNAPCENVCPVNATNHSPDGLNQMAYNRCVGTRYCANNCPYKVRRFNFYNFRDHFEDAYYDNKLSSLVNNPEVTVRSRGVIEKCSFCAQTIMEVREKAIREGREILPDEVQVSCQTACPTNAIVFGDVNNEKSTVKKYREHNLSYHVLEELNVVPNVTYLAKIRNTGMEEK